MGKRRVSCSPLETQVFRNKSIYFPVGYLERAERIMKAMIVATIKKGDVDYRAYHPLYKVLVSFASQVKKYNNGNESLLEVFLFTKLLAWEPEAVQSMKEGTRFEVPLDHYNNFNEIANSEDYDDYISNINYDLTLKSLLNICTVLQSRPEIGAVERYMFFKLINVLSYYTHSQLINNLWMHLLRIPLADPLTITYRSAEAQKTQFIGFRNFEALQEGVASWICFICEEGSRKRYRSYHLLQQHVHHIHPIYVIVCQICPERKLFQSLPNLEAHKFKDHQQNQVTRKSSSNQNKKHFMITRGSLKERETVGTETDVVGEGVIGSGVKRAGVIGTGSDVIENSSDRSVALDGHGSFVFGNAVGTGDNGWNAEKFLSRLPMRNKRSFLENWTDSTVTHHFPKRSKDEVVLQYVVSNLLQSKSVQIHCQEGVEMTPDNVFISNGDEDNLNALPAVRVIHHPNGDYFPENVSGNSQMRPLSSFDDFCAAVPIKTKRTRIPVSERMLLLHNATQKKSKQNKENQKKQKNKNVKDSDSIDVVPDPLQFKEFINDLLG